MSDKNLISVVAQAFYGNRVGTEIKRESVDNFILGYMDDSIATGEVNRTIVNIPNTDNVVIVYNKYQEERELNRKKELFNDEGYEMKPLVVIPEKNVEIYSRCIVCRMNENGELESMKKDDYDMIVKYLAE